MALFVSLTCVLGIHRPSVHIGSWDIIKLYNKPLATG